MDAMTHSSAGRDDETGSGRPSDAFARSGPQQGGPDWGWFTKVKPPEEDHGTAGGPQDGHGAPGRAPAAIRPVGGAADRGRVQHSAPARDEGRGSHFGGSPARDEGRPSSAGHGGAGRFDDPGEDLWGRRPGHPGHHDTPAHRTDPGDRRGDHGRPADRYDAPADLYDAPPDRYEPPAGRYGTPADRYEPPFDRRQPPADRYEPPVERFGRSEPSGRWGGHDDGQEPSYEPGGRSGGAGGGAEPAGGTSSLFERGLRPPPQRHGGPPPQAGPAGAVGAAGAGAPAGSWFGSLPTVPEAPAPSCSRAPQPPAPPAEVPEPTGTGSFGSDASASPDAILIRRTMRVIEPVSDKTTSYFYALLFLQHPHLRELFPAAMDTQRDRLFRALLTAAKYVDDAETLSTYLANLGRGHRKYGTRPEHYPAVGECLIGALTRYASEIWNDEVEAAWVRAYTQISQIMIDAAAEDESVAPAWWQAEIVAHERRTNNIAVISVRPDQPYPFLAGQYASLEVPWWPRVWRHYSFAAAPRADGLLSFHVKAVPAGWVSSALVNRARTGDVIRIGPPAGSMTVDHASDDGLLCLGGGTGIAPIKALVEDVAEHGRRRPVDVFYAARSGHDLYDLDTMQEMAARHSWLSLRPVVSDAIAPGEGLVAGHLPDIVTSMGPWPAYDAYLSGPPGMIRSSVSALLGTGMPGYRIRHDSLEELVSARD